MTLTNGVGTFSATFKTAGQQTLRAESGTLSVTSNSIAVGPGTYSLATSTLTASASTVSVGSTLGLTLTLKDAFGNLNPTGAPAASALTFLPSLVGGTGTINPPTNAGSGVYTATFSPVRSGAVSIRAEVAPGSVFTSTANLTVLPGPANSLALTFVPPSVVAGNSFSFTVTAKDQEGNNATGYTGSINIASSDPAATLPPAATLTNGVGSFNTTLKSTGSQTLTANDGVLSITSSGITVNSNLASQFVLGSVPANATAGTPFNISVTAKDSNGNTVTGYSGAVTITSSDGAAVLPAPATLTNGVGSFALNLKTAGSRTFTASDGLISKTSAGITVTPAGYSVSQSSVTVSNPSLSSGGSITVTLIT
ncbi:hypothetical protein EB061_10275, partial [bacterium]|nr:hypothetical protein [bacterium]